MYSRKWTIDNGQWTSRNKKISNLKCQMSNENGQTLMELIVVVSVSVIITGALVFATISSLRNASFSKNQSQATKLAQEGIEKVRGLRDRNGSVSYDRGGGGNGSFTSLFSELWAISFSCLTNCYFYFNSLGGLVGGASTRFEDVPPNFKRQIIIEGNGPASKKFSVIVRWTDFSGDHQSQLTTILRNLTQ